MQITFDIPDEVLTRTVRRKLGAALDFAPTDDQGIKEAVERMALAALSEYIEMIRHDGVPDTARTAQHRRLFFLVRDFFRDQVPSEANIALLLQLPRTKAATLLRDVLTRYETELEDKWLGTMEYWFRELQKVATKDKPVKFALPDHVVHEFNMLVATHHPKGGKIQRVRTTSATYEVPAEALQAIGEALSARRERGGR